MEYKLIRSGRRSLSVEVSQDGEVIVRAPYRMPLSYMEEFVDGSRVKIEAWIARAKSRKHVYPPNAEAECALRKRAEDIIPPKVEYYAKIMGVDPKGVRITAAQKRFGSCSNKGRLCFSLNLAQYSDDVIDYVVIHELAHLIELNHSKRFWAIVEKYIPDYKARRERLKE